MTTINKLEWRYATKKFNPEKTLSDEKLNIVKQAFNLTATSFGLQTIKLLVIKSKDIRQKLVEHSFGQKQVLEASHLLVLCIQDNIQTDDVEAHFDNVEAIRATPKSVLEPFERDLKNMMAAKSVEERQKWSVNQAYIALGNLMTVCAMEEIDSCPMEGFDPKAYDKLLNLESMNLRSVLLLPVGYRSNDDMFADFKKVRKSLEQTVIEM